MNILLMHQNFPGQFRHLALDLIREGKHRVQAIAHQTAPGLPEIPTLRYKLSRGNTRGQHRYLINLESGVVRGQAVARVLVALRDKGYRPDVVLAHPGWGEALFVKDIFPNARLVGFFEFYYRSRGADSGFDPDHPVNLDDQARIRTKNALHLLNLEACDDGISPTHWQKSVHPKIYHPKLSVLHEGIDTSRLKPDPEQGFSLNPQLRLRAGDPVVTYVARNLEPYRGFPQFMRAVPKILSRHPTAQIVVVGGDEISYGTPPPDAKHWREKLCRELGLENEHRLHFLGKIPYDRYAELLRVSKAHVYLTFPFVLSWSMMEAMSSGALIIGSRTAPVQEVIKDGQNGLLVDFFDIDAIADRVVMALDDRVPQVATLRARARSSMVSGYDIGKGVRGYRRLLGT